MANTRLIRIEGLAPYAETKIEQEIAEDLDRGMTVEDLAAKHFPLAWEAGKRERATQATLRAIARMQSLKEEARRHQR